MAQDGTITSYKTQGINPFHQDRNTIETVLQNELLPQLDQERQGKKAVSDVHKISFYGSGVRPELEPVMVDLLRQVFPQALAV